MSDRPDMGDDLAWLYPGQTQQGSVSDADLLASVRHKLEESIAAKRAFAEAGAEPLLAMAKALAEVFRGGGRLLTMGNGGSSSDAAHVAVEFNHPVTVGRRALPAIHLGADLQMITAIGNDVGFAEVFARQVIAFGQPGDALLGLSTSGSSDNLMAAYREARAKGLVTLGFAGHDGGRMASSELVDCCVVVPSPSVHRIQEVHVAAYHVLWDLVHTLLASKPAGGTA